MAFRVGGKGGGEGGAIAVPNDLRFAGATEPICEAARITFFNDNNSRLVKGVQVILEPTNQPIILQEYDGSVWRNMTSVVKGNQGDPASNLVQSVQGRTGNVTITRADLSLQNVDNTSDLNKPVSTAVQTALDAKANTVHTHSKANITDLESDLNTINTALSNLNTNKQDKLTSGTTIKTVNGNSLLGSGNIVIDAVQEATSAVTGGIRLTGDLGGTALSPSVTKINGVAVSNTGVASGKVLKATSGNTAAFDNITAADVGAIPTSAKGAIDGVAELDGNGRLPSARLPAGIVQSVNGLTGVVNITKTMLSLGSVDNTADADKPLSNDAKTAFNLKVDKSAIGANSGVCELDGNGKIPSSRIATLPTGETFVVANAAARLALSAAKGDVAIQQDTEESYRLKDTPATLPINWVKLLFPASVVSVNTKTGAVNLTKADLDLGNVDNTTDLGKPISTLTQQALNTKIDKSVLSAKGDLMTFDGSALIKHTKGTDGQVLKSDSTSPTGLKWETLPAALTINNTLTSDATNEPLSAAQGKALKGLVDAKPALAGVGDIPKANNNGAVGTSSLAARADHVHPETGIAITNFTAQGQMLVGTGTAAYGQVNLGTAGQVLTVDPTSIHTGVSWKTLTNATALADGLMSSAHYSKLEGLSNTTINDTLTSTSTTQALSANQGKVLNDGKANLASPTFTGVPAAPTAAADTNTTQLATTAFVVGQAGGAPSNDASSASAGTSLKYARADHVHRFPNGLHNGTRQVGTFSGTEYSIESPTANTSKWAFTDSTMLFTVNNKGRFEINAADSILRGPSATDTTSYRVVANDTSVALWGKVTANTRLHVDENGSIMRSQNATNAGGSRFFMNDGYVHINIKDVDRCEFGTTTVLRGPTKDDGVISLSDTSFEVKVDNLQRYYADNLYTVLRGPTGTDSGSVKAHLSNTQFYVSVQNDGWLNIEKTTAGSKYSIIVGSDQKIKTPLQEFPAELLDAWGNNVKWGSYQSLDSDDKRTRAGLIAQDVIKAFDEAGLDWKEWAVVHKDEEKDLLMVAYDYANAIENAYQRRRLDRIEKALGL